MTMDHAPLAAVAVLAALPATASTLCSFSVRCVDDAPCTPTDLSFPVEASDWKARLGLPGGSVQGQLGLTPAGATLALAIAPEGVHLLSVMDADGTARFTKHLTGEGTTPPRAITYLGHCREE
jgi:hypothetical protein